MATLFFVFLLKIIGVVLSTLTGQYPLTETCLCVTGKDVTARNSCRRCQDEPACLAIQQARKDLCQIPEFMIYCNMTCGVCGQIGVGRAKCPGNSGDDPCKKHPCVHGQCSPKRCAALSTYVCSCDVGYIGVNCDHRDPCYSQPCVHGQCVALMRSSGYKCKCDLGFTGLLCDKNCYMLVCYETGPLAVVINECPGSCMMTITSYNSLQGCSRQVQPDGYCFSRYLWKLYCNTDLCNYL